MDGYVHVLEEDLQAVEYIISEFSELMRAYKSCNIHEFNVKMAIFIKHYYDECDEFSFSTLEDFGDNMRKARLEGAI